MHHESVTINHTYEMFRKYGRHPWMQWIDLERGNSRFSFKLGISPTGGLRHNKSLVTLDTRYIDTSNLEEIVYLLLCTECLEDAIMDIGKRSNHGLCITLNINEL